MNSWRGTWNCCPKNWTTIFVSFINKLTSRLLLSVGPMCFLICVSFILRNRSVPYPFCNNHFILISSNSLDLIDWFKADWSPPETWWNTLGIFSRDLLVKIRIHFIWYYKSVHSVHWSKFALLVKIPVRFREPATVPHQFLVLILSESIFNRFNRLFVNQLYLPYHFVIKYKIPYIKIFYFRTENRTLISSLRNKRSFFIKLITMFF